MPGGWELFATAGIILTAGFITGLAGFGFALFAVPPLLFFHDANTVVALVDILGFCSTFVVVLQEPDRIEWPVLRSLLPTAGIGLVCGTLLLRYVDGTY